LFSGFTGCCQFVVPGGENLLFPAFELVVGRDVADGAVKPLGVVILNKIGNHLPGIRKGKQAVGPDTLGFQALVPPLDLTVALGIIRRCPDMAHTADSDEFLEVFSGKLRAIVRNDSRMGAGDFFPGSLQNDLDIGFGHRLSDFPVHDMTAVTVQDTAKVIKRAQNI